MEEKVKRKPAIKSAKKMAKTIMKARKKRIRDAKTKQKALIKSQAAKNRLKQKKLNEERLNIKWLNRIKPHDLPNKLDSSEEENGNMDDAKQTGDEASSDLIAEETENWVDRETVDEIDAVGNGTKPDSPVSKHLFKERDNQGGKKWGKKKNKLRSDESSVFPSASSIERGLKKNLVDAQRKAMTDSTQQSLALEKPLASLSPPASTKDKSILLTRPKSGTGDLNSEIGECDLTKLVNSRLNVSKLNESLIPGKKSKTAHFRAAFFSKEKQKKAADLLEKSKYLPGFDRLEQRIRENVLERQAIEALDDLPFNMMLFNLAKQVFLDDKFPSKADKEEKHKITKRKSGKRGRISEWLTALNMILQFQDDNEDNKTAKPRRLSGYTNQYEKKVCPLMTEDLKLRQNGSSDSLYSCSSESCLDSYADDDDEAHRFRDLKRLYQVIRLFQAPKKTVKTSHGFKKTSADNSTEAPNQQMTAYQRDLHDCILFLAYPTDESLVYVCMCTSAPNYYYVPSDLSTNFTNPAITCDNTLFVPHLTEIETVYFPELYYC